MHHVPLPDRLRRPVVAALLALVSSCGAPERNVLELASALPAGEVARDTALVLTFSRAVVPPDSVNRWSATPYIEFSPAIPGRFVWQDTSRLVFSADGPLPGDAQLTGRLNTDLLLRLSGAESFSGEKEFTITTPAFTLVRAEFFYDRVGEQRLIGIKANIEFAYDVDPSDLQSVLRVEIDGQRREVRVVSPSPGRIIAVELGTLERLDRERQITLSLSGELFSPETGTRLDLERPLTTRLAALGDLQIYGHEFAYDGVMGWITVRTSQELDLEAVRAALSVEPRRDYDIELRPDGFAIRGKFEPGLSFRVSLAKGLTSVLGGTLRHDYEATVVFGNVQPTFAFASPEGQYMLLGGERALEIKTVNISALAVRVSQIFQNNLVFFLENGRYYDYWSYGEEGRRKFRYVVGNYGRELAFDTLAIAGDSNREVTTRFDLAPYLGNGYRGFYLVEIADPAQAWRSSAQLVVLSDLGMIVKKSADEVLVFVTDLRSAQPVPGVRVTLVSTTNQVIGTAQTDADGLARFDAMRSTFEEFPPKLVTAEAGEDFTFLNLEDSRLETSRFDVAGRRTSGGPYEAFLYGERTIYRPGERVIVAGLVREPGEALPARMPVRLRVSNPQGRIVQEQQLVLNDQASFESSYETTPSSLTGEYRLTLVSATDQTLASYRVSVEDFVPDRLNVSLEASAQAVGPGETIGYLLSAHHFFGPPAADRPWEFEGSFENVPYLSRAFPKFRFANDAAPEFRANPEVSNGRTGADGSARISFAVPAGLTSRGLLLAKARIAVFDESGRPVYRTERTTVHPREYHIGVRNRGAYYVSPGTQQKAELIAVDRHDRPIEKFKATVRLIRFEWHAVLRQHQGSGTLRYVSEKREIPVSSQELTLSSSPVEYTYSVPRSGEYAVRVSRTGDDGYNEFRFYSYRWGTTDATSFAVDPEARVEIVLDRAEYRPGETARVLFQTPFSGRMLVTVERHRVFSYRYLEVVDNAASMEILVGEELLPNAYVCAVLFRAVPGQDIPLLAGHGVAPLLVSEPGNRLDIAIEAPAKIRPRTMQTVTVRTGRPGAMLTVAAVDEGICQLKNYTTPDPYEAFYARRALETETFDYFKDLIPEAARSAPRPSTGGGADEMGLRVSPLGVQRFKPVALWSGLVQTDARGAATVSFEIPAFSGELRLMAIAFKDARYGSASRPMVVADPVVISAALPRFLAPGDSAVMSVTGFNTTGEPVTLDLAIATEGGIRAGTARGSLALGANEEGSLDIPVRATTAIGKAVVRIRTSAFGEDLLEETELPVRPGSPYLSESVTGYLDAGQSFSHAVEDRYLSYGRRAWVTLSPYPVANFAEKLSDLVGYPHGCIEQTVSRAFPQIYLRDIAAILDPSILEKGSPTYFVNEAITKVASMQGFDGGFLYWPGGGEVNSWSTVYATHFLLEARKAGYEVSDRLLNPALEAVARIARSRATVDVATSREGRTTIRRLADKASVYALYVLALAGRPEEAVMNFYRGMPELLSADTRFLLAGSFALSGNRLAYQAVLPPEFEAPEPTRTSGGSFDSAVRANALIANVLLETDLNSPLLPRYLEYLSRKYKQQQWFSTQENAFTLLAFGKAARIASRSAPRGTLSVGSEEFDYDGGTRRFAVEPWGKTATLSMQGEGRVYYSIVVEGIRQDGAVPLGDSNLRIRREYFNRRGASVNPASARQNDLLVVRLSLSSSVDRLDHIAVTDLLPAGFEIDNPRVTETTVYPFVKNASVPEYLDIRDDRINFYTSFRGGARTQTFYYVVRVVSRGVFRLPPVVAEAMYDGSYRSASGGGRVSVIR